MSSSSKAGEADEIMAMIPETVTSSRPAVQESFWKLQPIHSLDQIIVDHSLFFTPSPVLSIFLLISQTSIKNLANSANWDIHHRIRPDIPKRLPILSLPPHKLFPDLSIHPTMSSRPFATQVLSRRVSFMIGTPSTSPRTPPTVGLCRCTGLHAVDGCDLGTRVGDALDAVERPCEVPRVVPGKCNIDPRHPHHKPCRYSKCPPPIGIIMDPH
jgi:hypothetical protein